MRNVTLIEKDVRDLKQQFDVTIEGNHERVLIRAFPLPKNWENNFSDLLLVLPDNFPQSPPRLFLSRDSRLRKRSSEQFGYFHSFNKSDAMWPLGWGWMCFNHRWEPATDGIFSFLQLMDGALSNVFADRDEPA